MTPPGAVAAKLIREALGIDPATEDTTALTTSIRLTFAQCKPSERTQVAAHLAVLAAAFAAPWPASRREELLSLTGQPQDVKALLDEVYAILQRAEEG